MKELKRGQIAVNKKTLTEHCELLRKELNKIDLLMTEKESVDRGKKIAKVCNAINYSLDKVERFELGIKRF